MKIGRAIQIIDRLKPNKFERADKVRWLSELDALIWQELITTHEMPVCGCGEGWAGEAPADPAFPGYPDDAPDDTELLVNFPNDSLYLRWLESQIDLHNMEINKYNQSRAMFNSAYLTFTDWYNRTHMPKQGGGFVFTERRETKAGEQDALSS